MRRAPLLVLALASGCSLVVEGAQPPTCAANDDCAILNELEGIAADACELYQCDVETDRCAFGVRDADRDGRIAPECASVAPEREVDCNDQIAGGQERCNGLDDDCDGVIDEGVSGAPPALLFTAVGTSGRRLGIPRSTIR